ncbi:hypothetical protein [Noviluteimonas gilva]|uniref:Uncharacterized protein n=1 Tax=Noviluteimonas gilva TaxID=2682097 RepID=A0A7C9HMF5_9GAMM|nr:hypothetical protein [Lysobacter gilvus]MUV14432.1 hypothetical protein [Lysobacter gilvus]
MTTKIIAATLLCACALFARDASAQRCPGAFLSADSDWRAQTFDGAQIPWTTGDWPDAKVFTPIEALYVRKGKVYATTWKGEALPARAKVVGDEIRISPPYIAWFPGVDSPIMRQAKRVVPYSEPQVRHVLSVANACAKPPAIDVVITLADGRNERVTLAKMPKTSAVFDDSID